MIIYKVYREDFECGYYSGDTEVRYYISEKLAEEDLNKRLEEWPPAKIEEIRTED